MPGGQRGALASWARSPEDLFMERREGEGKNSGGNQRSRPWRSPQRSTHDTGVWGCSDLHLCAHQCWTLLVQCSDQIKSGSGRCLHDVQNLGTGLQHWLTWRCLNLKGVSRAALWKQCMFKTLTRTQEKILATSGTGDKVCDNQRERTPSLSPEF